MKSDYNCSLITAEFHSIPNVRTDFHPYRILIKKKEYLTLRYRVLSGDSFESPIFFPTTLTNCSSGQKTGLTQNSLYTLANHKGRCMSHVISMHRSGDLGPTAVSDLSKVIPCLVASRFEHTRC
jgi:hypothetical protein